MSVRAVGSARARRLTTAVALVACVAAGPRPSAAAPGELRVGVARLPATLDPTTAVNGSDLMIDRLLFQGLVRRGEHGEIRPALAARWAVSRDGLTWTFRLRPDLRFQTGAPVTADDVVTSLARQIGSDEPADGAAPWSRLFRGSARIVREIRRGADGTVQIQLGQPFSPLLAVLAHPAFGIATAAGGGDAAPVGTGPYHVVERDAGRLVLEAPPSAAVRTPRLVFSEVPDDLAGIGGLAPGGQLDVYVAQGPPAGTVRGLRTVSAPTWQVGFLALRTDRGVLRQRVARQAIALALDPAIVQPALLPWAWPYGAYLPPGAWGARDAPPVFDPKRARQLLEQAGAVNAALTLVAPDASGGPGAPRLADAVRLALAAVGLSVTVRTEPPGEALRVMRQGGADMALDEVSLALDDPQFLFRPLLASEAASADAGTNLAFFRSPLVDSMLLRAGQLGYRPERLRLYQRLQAALAEEWPYVPLYVRLQWVVARPEVRGLALDPADGVDVKQVWLEAPPMPATPPPPPAPPSGVLP